MGPTLVRLIGQSLAEVVPGFDERRFRREASRDLDGLELKERAAHIARAMAAQMPTAFEDLAPLLIESLDGQGRSTIACTIAHQKYPGRVPADTVLLRAFVGGALHEDRLDLDDAAMVAATLADLRLYLGSLPEPRLARVHRWPKAMAQYVVGHGDRIGRIRALTPPGLHLVGNGYDGVGIPDVVAQAARIFGPLVAR
jgi:oxygen-dependent protoporphyrinogen oxidase